MVQKPRKPGLNGCDPSLLHTLLRRFHHVRTIELFDPIFDSVQLAAHASALAVTCAEEGEAAAPIDLDTLILTHGPRSQTPLVCFAWFGSVSKLVIRSNAHSRRNVPVHGVLDCLPARLAARALVLESAVSAEVRECLHRSPTFGHEGTLRALHVRLSSLSEATLGAYLRPTSHMLEELHLDLTPWRTGSTEVAATLGELPRLRELTMQFWMKDSVFGGAGGWDAVHAVMDTLLLRPQSRDIVDTEHGLLPLRCVTLVLHGGLSVSVHGLQFARISAVLAGVPTLERCTLDLQEVFDESGALDQRRAWFGKHMAELHTRGALRFVT